MSDPCPCGSGQTYTVCCAPLHQGQALAQTPEQLMRSRYCAFARRLPAYLAQTHHPSRREPNEVALLRAHLPTQQWLGLKIVDAPACAGDRGEVEFIAYFQEGASRSALHERSRFVREEGRWFYLDGDLFDGAQRATPGRNDPCWCGSGKKYKKCHAG